MERSHDQFRAGNAGTEVRGQDHEPKPEVIDTAEPNGRHIDLNESEGAEEQPSASGETHAMAPQPEEPDIEDNPEPSETCDNLATAPRLEGLEIEGFESELDKLKAEFQQLQLAQTVCNIEKGQILATVHANYPDEVYKRFVKEIGLKPNMATKLRAMGYDSWFNRPEVRQQFRGAEKTELYYAHCLDDGQKEVLLARCQAGEPISRKLIDEVSGKIPKNSDNVIVVSVSVKRDCVSQWQAHERIHLFKLVADFKLQCDTEAPYGVSCTENLEKLRPKK